MKPTETLKHEHKIILLVLAAAEREVNYAGETGTLHTENVRKMLEFFREFVDRCHHTKEEKHLFKMMQQGGMSRESGPVVVMLHEHEMGRQLVKNMAEMLSQTEESGAPAATGEMADATEFCCGATSKAATAAVADNLRVYIQLSRDHIEKEDGILYTLADRMLALEDQQALEREFEKVESEELGAGVHEKYHRLAHELASN